MGTSTFNSERDRAVLCNVYAVTPCVNRFAHLISLKASNWGIYHSGIEVYGTEYSFGGHSGSSTGISAGRPRSVIGARFLKAILLGVCKLDEFELRGLLAEISTKWTGRSYHPLLRNCNHFSFELSLALECAPPPAWINAFSRSCLVRSLLPLVDCISRWAPIVRIQLVDRSSEHDAHDPARSNPHGMVDLLYDAAKVQKQRGNELYAEREYLRSLQAYRKATEYVSHTFGLLERDAKSLRYREMGRSGRAISPKTAVALPLRAASDEELQTNGVSTPAAIASPSIELNIEQLQDLQVLLWTNCAACLLKIGNPVAIRAAATDDGTAESLASSPSLTSSHKHLRTDDEEVALREAIELCSKVLQQRPMQPKALYRRAVAQRLLGNLDSAKDDLLLAVQVSTGAEIKSELAHVKELQKMEREVEKGLYQRMFKLK